jgi:indole-3-glycerol phosphate synthase
MEGNNRINLKLIGSELITVLNIQEGVNPSDHVQVEIKYVSGDSSAQNEQVRVLEESKKDIEYNPIEDEYPAELQAIDDQIQALIEEIENIPPIGTDDTLYWEGWYRHHGKVQAVRRMSYNTQGGVHKLGGTPFRKNYAGVGYMYDPVRDAFYNTQPYPSWTLNEDTCYWEAPTPRPEGMDWFWNEPTLEWLDKPGYKEHSNFIYDETLKNRLSVIVEVHDESEAERALKYSEAIIGINNRDLKTLDISLENSVKIQKKLTSHKNPLISESGIKNKQDVQYIYDKTGIKNFLVGESLLSSAEPSKLIQELLSINL